MSDPGNQSNDSGTLAETARGLNRARLIRRSLRCFYFGLIALIPCLGVPFAFLAFHLQRQIAKETGEKAGWTFAQLVWILLSEAIALSSAVFMPEVIELTILIAAMLQAAVFLRRYENNPPGEWNPGRRMVYLGSASACFGLTLSAVLLAAVTGPALLHSGQ